MTFPKDIYDRELGEPHEDSRVIPWPLGLLISVIACFGSYYYGAFAGPGAGGASSGSTPAGVAATAPAADGKKLFETRCAACHQKTGQGVPGAFPPLDGSEWVTGAPEAPIAILSHGLNGEISVAGKTFRGAMPTFKTLKDEEIAAVVSYIRSSWGNKAAPVDAAAVAEVRKATADRKGPWKGEAELREFLGDKAP